MSKNAWMVGAGDGAFLNGEFDKGVVAVGWHEVGEITDKSQRELRHRLAGVYPGAKAATSQELATVLWRFAQVIKMDDIVVTYDPARRQYLIGEIASDYRFEAQRRVHPHIRETVWHHRVSRDQLSVSTWNSLGSTLTPFAIPAEAMNELQLAAKREGMKGAFGGGTDQADQRRHADGGTEEQAREPVEDMILALDSCELQELVDLLPVD